MSIRSNPIREFPDSAFSGESRTGASVQRLSRSGERGLFKSCLRALATALFCVYLGWNIYWWSQWRLAPSLLVALTGLPSPTTGGTRSLLALVHGQWLESLRLNAMTLPLCALLAVSVAQLGWQVARRRTLRLAPVLVWLWACVLILAWALKLAGDPMYWQ